MARQKHQPNRRREGRSLGRGRLKVSTAIALIVGFELIALSIKAFDDRKTSITSLEQVTHREALAVSEYMSGKIEQVRLTLSLGYRSGWDADRTANALSELDAVVNLADALTAPSGSRLGDAGETAATLLGMDLTLGLSKAGDFVVMYAPETGAARFGLVKAGTWLPSAAGERQFALEASPVDGVFGATAETLTACSPLKQGPISVCVETVRAPFGQVEILRLLGYGLLLLGPALGMLGLFKLLERRAGESEAFEGQATRAGRVLQTVLKEAKAGFWSWDFDRSEVWLSEEASSLLGIDATGYLPSSQLLDCVHADHRSLVSQSLETLPHKNYLSQVFANKDRTVWLDMRARPDPDSGEVNGILLDITDMRAAVARTKQAEQRLRSALEGFSGPFALWDKRKRLVYWNRAFTRVFGLEDSVRAGMGHETVRLAQAAGISERRPGLDGEESEIVQTMDGTWFKMVERKTSAGSMITMGLDVSVDIERQVQMTEQQNKLKQLIQELERSESHAGELATRLNKEKIRAEESANSKSAFLANMSHELRTPLNAINGFSEIISSEMYGPLGNQKYRDYAEDILTSGEHLLDMINDILDMAKIEAGKMTIDPRPLDLIEPVDAAVRMIRRKAEDKGIKLLLRSADNLPPVDADHRAIRQMILNLVSNAIKFTDDGGTIQVSIEQRDDMLRVAVRDNGVGIPSEALPRLAEPFEQVSDTRDRNYEGTGLGLALTKSFAEMHGGRLSIASEPGKGTLVCFYIPISKEELERSVA